MARNINYENLAWSVTKTLYIYGVLISGKAKSTKKEEETKTHSSWWPCRCAAGKNYLRVLPSTNSLNSNLSESNEIPFGTVDLAEEGARGEKGTIPADPGAWQWAKGAEVEEEVVLEEQACWRAEFTTWKKEGEIIIWRGFACGLRELVHARQYVRQAFFTDSRSISKLQKLFILLFSRVYLSKSRFFN